MIFLLSLACSSPDETSHVDDTGSAVDTMDTGDTVDTMNTVDTGDTDTGVPLEACPVIETWTDNAGIPAGTTVTWFYGGCGAPVYSGCVDPAVAIFAGFEGALEDGTFGWSVTAVAPGTTPCTLTVGDPRDDDREEYEIALTVFTG